MNAAEWTLVKSLFSRATAVPLEQRETWLRAQGDFPSGVTREVLRLWQHKAESATGAVPQESRPTRRTLEPAFRLSNRFVIDRFLGSGGMGEVYLAEDLVLHIPVAIKTVREDLLSDTKFPVRLEQEVLAARSVQHENVCTVFDLHTEAGGLTYVSMEYLNGRTLAERLLAGALELAEVRRLAQELAAGLQAIHRAGIVHRDLKSGNVFLVEHPAPRVVIADFGLAYDTSQPVSETISLFGPRAIVGTPSYMAPEQLLGQGAGTAADIYAFGVILYECVTGTLPFPGATPLEVALRRLEVESVPSPREQRPTLPRSWDYTIRGCLAKDARKRPGTARDVVAMLDEPPPWRVSRRAVMASTTVGLAGLAGAGVYQRATKHKPPAEAVYHFKLGEEYVRRTSNREILAGIKELRKAVDIDPAYAEAWAYLAEAYCQAINYTALPIAEARA